MYTFTPTLVIATYKLCPYKTDKYYVVSEYINNNTAVRNTSAIQYITVLQLSNITTATFVL
jgi:hypothetical protein